MAKLLPRHLEIIKEIDKRVFCRPFNFLIRAKNRMARVINFLISFTVQFMAMIKSARTDMESNLATMRILDDSNPQKPVVRMANLCVISSHTVKELHGENLN